MQYRFGRMLDMLLRVESMLARPELAPLASSPAIALLGTTIATLKRSNTQQDVGDRSSKGETAKLRELRQALFAQMRTVAAAARLQLPEAPELVKFTVPISTAATAPLLAAAGGMSDAAVEHEALLLETGLAPGFIERLRAAADALRESITTRAGYRGTRHRATTSIRTTARSVRPLILLLDGLVKPLIAETPGLVEEWKQAIRIGLKPGVPRGGATPAIAAVA